MRHFVHGGIPTVAFGPGLPELAHSDLEYVNDSDLVRASKIYALACMRFVKS